MSGTLVEALSASPPVVLHDPTRSHEPRWRAGDRLHHVFEQVCDAEGTGSRKLAVDGLGADGKPERVTYGDLDAAANRLARHLVERGVRAGDRVALLCDRPLEAYTAMLAVLKAHAAYVPMDAGYPVDRLAYIVIDSGATTVVTRGGLAPLVAGAGVPVICPDDDAAAVARHSPARLTPSDTGSETETETGSASGSDDDRTAYVIYTSGSTGRPKGVAVEHAAICNFVRVAAEVYGVRPDDRVYQGMTIAFDFSVEEIWVPWACRATLVPRPPGGSLVGPDLHTYLRERDVTALCCVPTLLATLDDDLPQLRFLLVSGEACPADLVQRWWRPDRRLLNVYGPTEATVTATWTELAPDRPVTIGIPLPTYSCVVLDPDTGAPVAPGDTGELGIAGIGLAVGYVNRPDLTQAAFVPDALGIPYNPSGRVYRTGDLVRALPDGQIEYLGRIDLQVKIRGYRIELTEIESVIMEFPGVAAAVVTTHRPAEGVVELAGFFTVRAGFATVDPRDVQAALRERLPPYMVPAYLDRLGEIPLTPSDKADRAALPVPSHRLTATSGPVPAPTTATESALAAALADVLGLAEVSVTADFFGDLGADSLIMARFCARVRDAGGALSMRDVYATGCLAALAATMDEATATGVGGVADAGSATSPGAHLRLRVLMTGLAQSVFLLAGLALTAVIGVQGYRFMEAGAGPADYYARAVAVSAGLFALATLLPLTAKWLLVGRWREGEIRLWSLAYLRFWVVTRLQRLSPLAAYGGSSLQIWYLRALGARIGRDVTLLTADLPACPDLVTIGDGVVVRPAARLRGYRPEAGRLRLGRIDLGSGVIVGENCVVDVDTQMRPNAVLLHASSLQPGQCVPDGETWHGSPARPAPVRLAALDRPAARTTHRIRFALAQLAWTLLVVGPLTFGFLELIVSEIALGKVPGDLLAALEPTSAADLATLTFAWHVALAGAVLYVTGVVGGLALALTLPRILARGVPVGVPHPLPGFRFAIARLVRRLTNVRFQMQLFGDSSYIVGYLRLLGYRTSTAHQTGSNFGLDARHETPYLVSIGLGTMVSDGLTTANAEYGASSFRWRPVHIGARSFLGNEVLFPADAHTGDNCLYGTKVAVPTHGPIRRDVGLLGSPAFEIPRSVDRDTAVRDEADGGDALAAKNRHNLMTMVMFLAHGWWRLTMTLALALAVGLLPVAAEVRVVLILLGGLTLGLVSAILVERATTRFGRLRPRLCTIHDPAFWRHERYWKLSLSRYLAPFAGTPMRPMLLRRLGVRVGRAVFDDGCGIPERSLVTIGDRVSIGAGATIQGHSLEDGVFKSDFIEIGSDVVLGVGAFVHYGTSIGDGATIAADSFLMKGEKVPSGGTWTGNPAAPARSGGGRS